MILYARYLGKMRLGDSYWTLAHSITNCALSDLIESLLLRYAETAFEEINR